MGAFFLPGALGNRLSCSTTQPAPCESVFLSFSRLTWPYKTILPRDDIYKSFLLSCCCCKSKIKSSCLNLGVLWFGLVFVTDLNFKGLRVWFVLISHVVILFNRYFLLWILFGVSHAWIIMYWHEIDWTTLDVSWSLVWIGFH